MTAGNQKWQGGIPSFTRRPRIIVKLEIEDGIIVWFEKYRLSAPDRIRPEPKAWAKKYFILASLSILDLDKVRSGIKDRRFSSRPTQIISQLVEEIEISDPIVRVERNRVE